MVGNRRISEPSTVVYVYVRYVSFLRIKGSCHINCGTFECLICRRYQFICCCVTSNFCQVTSSPPSPEGKEKKYQKLGKSMLPKKNIQQVCPAAGSCYIFKNLSAPKLLSTMSTTSATSLSLSAITSTEDGMPWGMHC